MFELNGKIEKENYKGYSNNLSCERVKVSHEQKDQHKSGLFEIFRHC